MAAFCNKQRQNRRGARKALSMFFGGGQYAFMTATENLEVIFKEDRSLFYAGDLRLSARLRDMETNYGILPYPKYDENQENTTHLQLTIFRYTFPFYR